MSHRRNVTFVVLLVCGAASAAAAQPATPPREAPVAESFGTAVIKGQVVDAATGRGLPRVTLELQGGEPAGSAGEMTDDDGRFEFRGLPPGRYSIAAEKTAYERLRVPEYQRGRRAQFLELTAGGRIEALTIALHRASAITGRVVDWFGEPATNVRVSVRTFPVVGGTARRQPGQSDSMTNDIGEFRIAPIPPGRYLLTAEARVEPFFRRGQQVERSGFVVWPQAPSLDSAQPLVVERGQDVRDLELQLFPTKPARVSGVILGLDGAPATNAMISVGFISPGDTRSYGGTSTDAREGRFELTLSPGTYDLTARTNERGNAGPNHLPLASASTRVAVFGEPIEGLTFQLAPPRTISGRLTFMMSGLQTQPPDPAAVRVFASGNECRATDGVVKPDLTFELKAAGNRCYITANPAGRWHLRSLTQGGEDIAGSGLSLGQRTSVSDVVITFGDRPTKVSVSVADAKGQAATEFLVVVFPVDAARRPNDSRSGQSFSVTRELGPTSDGRPLSTEGLLPGEYYAIAIHPDDYDTSGLPGSYELLEPLAQRFTLGDADVRVLALTVVDMP